MSPLILNLYVKRKFNINLKNVKYKDAKYALENNLTRVKDLYFEFGTGWEQIGLVKEIKYKEEYTDTQLNIIKALGIKDDY